MRIGEVITGNYRPTGDPGDANCIVALSFGGRQEADGKITPGPINEALGRQALDLANKYDLPILAQKEVADVIQEIAGDDDSKSRVCLCVSKHRNEGEYLDSYEVLQQMARYALFKGMQSPIVIAQAYHAPRVARQAKYVCFKNVIVPEGLTRDWDKQSCQPWTRGPLFWVPREILGTLVLKWQKKM
jgi:hypothetical protein